MDDHSGNILDNQLMHICSCKKLDLDSMENLLAQGANLEYMDRRGNTPLALCLISRHFDAAEILIRKGAETNILFRVQLFYFQLSSKFESCLSVSVGRNNLKMVSLLLKHGAKIELTPDIGFTALSTTAKRFPLNLDIMKLLIEAGLNPIESREPKYGYSLLEHRIRQCCDVEEELLAPPPSPKILQDPFDTLRYRFIEEYPIFFSFIRFFITIGCLNPSAIFIQRMSGRRTFLTLATSYLAYIQIRKDTFHFPASFLNTAEQSITVSFRPQAMTLICRNADILKDMIQRTRSMCVNPDAMLRHLHEVCHGAAGIMEIPTLQNLAIDAVRLVFVKRGGSWEDDVMNPGLKLPRLLKRKLLLLDLEHRIARSRSHLIEFA